MHKKYRVKASRALFALIFTALFIPVFPNKPNFKFDRIGIEKGLSDNFVEKVLQDSKGFMWFATANGVNKYDGYSCEVFKHIEGDTTSLSYNYIYNLFKTSDGNIWVGYRFGGVAKYKPEINAFDNSVFPDDSIKNATLKNDMREIYEDEKGNQWMLNYRGVCKLSKEGNWSYYVECADKTFSFKNKFSMRATEDANGNLYIVFVDNRDIFRYNVITDSFDKLNLKPADNKSSLGFTKTSIVVDYENNLWCGTIGSGIVKINLDTETYVQYNADNASGRGLQVNEIACIYEDSKKNIWVGSINGGLHLYDRKKDYFYSYKFNEFDKNSISSNSVRSVIEAENGSIWLTTHGGGVNVLDYDKNSFKFIGKSLNDEFGLQSNIVSCFHELKNGNIWIGTDGGGLHLYNFKEGVIKVITTDNGLKSNAILDIIVDNNENVWVATWGGGISFINTKTYKITTYEANTGKNSLNFPHVKGMLLDGDLLWIPTHGNGINIFDTKTKIFYNNENKHPAHTFDYNEIYWGNSILKDRKGDFWFTSTNGLYRIHNNKIDRFVNTYKGKFNLSGNNVNSIIEDNDGVIWVGTTALDMFDEKEQRFVNVLSTSDGFYGMVKTILVDKYNNFWISTNEGLYYFNPKTKNLKRFTTSDGIQSNHFYERSGIITKNNVIMLGGYHGINYFKSDEVLYSLDPPKVHITSIEIWNTDSASNAFPYKLIANQNTEIAYNKSRMLSINYVGLNLMHSEKIEYRCMLEGFSHTWKYTGKNRTASYTNLPPGDYSFKVQARLSGEKDFSETSTFNFTIISPWWLTWWTKIGAVLLIIVLVLVYIYLREKNIKRQNEILEKTVKERTDQLELANTHLEDQQDILKAQNEQLLEKQLVIKLRNDELLETMETKDKLLSVLANDLKNPLSSVRGMTGMLWEEIENLSDDKVKKYAKTINDSVGIVSDQLNDILSWAKSAYQNIAYSPSEFDIQVIARDIISLFSQSARNKDISIKVFFKAEHMCFADSRMINVVLRNIISNSIKFTPKKGTVICTIGETDKKIIISVKDSGIGIPKENIQKVFEGEEMKISYGTDREVGVGMGLKISADFIKTNNGSINVNSKDGEGTEFIITLPKGQEKIDKSEISEDFDFTEDFADVAQNMGLMVVIDDNKELADFIHDAFSSLFKVEIAFNANTGLDIIHKVMPDIVISDIHLPDFSGIELCHKIKTDEMYSHIPIILTTAEVSDQKQIESFTSGADGYITKPFDIELLRTKVKTLIANRNNYKKFLLNNSITASSEQIDYSQYEDPILKRSKEIIEENVKNPELTVEYLAGKVGVSRSQLFRKFKAALGYSPIEFIKKYRLQKASDLLRNTQLRISEVAYEVGFSDPKYFSSCFSKEFNISPSQYQERHH